MMDFLNPTETVDDSCDLSPLVDLMTTLVGLVMLLATTSVLARVPVPVIPPVPQTSSAAGDEVLLSFDADGTLQWNESTLDWGELENKLKSLVTPDRPVTILLAGHAAGPYEVSLRIEALCQQHGIELQKLAKPSDLLVPQN